MSKPQVEMDVLGSVICNHVACDERCDEGRPDGQLRVCDLAALAVLREFDVMRPTADREP